MKQRAHFRCPVGGQALVAFYDEKVQRLEVDALHHQDLSEDAETWIGRLGPFHEHALTIDDARAMLVLHGVGHHEIEFEGI